MEAKDRAILVAKAGSHAYGLSRPTSDLDIRGIFVNTDDMLRSFVDCPTEYREDTPDDLVLYELRKFFKLAHAGNPNILEILYTDSEDVLFIHELGKLLIENREMFLSNKILKTFGGYAYGQLFKIKRQYANWYTPSLLPTGKQDHIDSVINFGYDTKDAMHLLRLGRMCKEILLTGEINVKRPDRDFLLGVRDGKVHINEIVKEAEELDKECYNIVKDGKSVLRDTPDIKALDHICKTIYKLYTPSYTKWSHGC